MDLNQMKNQRFLLLLIFLLPLACWAQDFQKLSLPNHEQLSTEQVLQVIQDSEGFLWYATEGGGVWRDDGRKMVVFRSDAAHPDLLRSNDVSSLADAGRFIIIGTYHGANLLDKHDYSISRLEDVDDKRVDDIIVGHNGHWWLTANKKVYEYTAEGKLINIYPGGDKYIFRLHEDRQGRLWAAEWEGGLLRLDGGQAGTGSAHQRLVAAAWPVDVAPTAIEDDLSTADGLVISTFGRGVVKYDTTNGTVEMTVPNDSICMSRVSYDNCGRRLVADGLGNCYVLSDNMQKPWWNGRLLTRNVADSIRIANHLSERPTAFAISKEADLWFSTGKDIRCISGDNRYPQTEEVVLSDTKDVSAMVFTKDGTLWLATIYGTLMSYKDGKLVIDQYASNEYSDGVTQLDVDSQGRLLIVSDHYIRLYDPLRQTLSQQSREREGVYRIELQETKPGKRWSQPEEEAVVRIPQWVWWMLALAFLIFILLVGYVWQLRRQRKQFIDTMKRDAETLEQVTENQSHLAEKHGQPTGDLKQSAENSEQSAEDQRQSVEEQPVVTDEWLQNAIAHVEAHMSDSSYSVEQLTSDLCVSRMTFYRKIQSATGQKPTEFIRSIRLRHAVELLKEGQMTITEVSYATGFSSVSYFSRCFRTMYGVPPTQFLAARD
jgi:AraC-like DNA-binding protein/ligand-binding sensor domain-containing protein